MDAAAKVLNTAGDNLKPFFARGGKLLMYHGWSDQQNPASTSVSYFRRVVKAAGKSAVGKSIQLYMVPGMNHCQGGVGTDTFDKVAVDRGMDGEGHRARRRSSRRMRPTAKSIARALCVRIRRSRYIKVPAAPTRRPVLRAGTHDDEERSRVIRGGVVRSRCTRRRRSPPALLRAGPTTSSSATAASSMGPAARGIAPMSPCAATRSRASRLSITEPATRVVDANGQIVSPGFIDIHNHARENFFQLPSADNYIRQGVTTLIEGPDGGSPVPLGPFLDKLDATQKSINIGSFIGQGSVREAVLGRANRRPTPAELDKMRGIVEDGMKAGAFGMSTGLFYVPGAFTPIEEVIELAKVAGKYGGIHISHMRDEAFGVLDSVRETIRIGEEGGPADAGDASQDRRAGELRQERRDAEAARGRAPPRRRRDERSVSLHCLEQRVHRVDDSAVGTGGRARADARAPEEPRDAQGDRRGDRAHHPRRARRRRSQERLPRALRLRRVDGGKEPGGRRTDAWDGADDRERRRSGHVGRRAGQLPGRVPRDERAGPRARHAASGDDDRVGWVGADSGAGRAASEKLWHLRARARACTCASATSSRSRTPSGR